MPNDSRTWTIISLLQQASNYLQEKHFEQPRLQAEYLLAKTLNLNRINLYLQFDRPLSIDEVDQFRILLQRRLKHEPLQYILAETEFMSLPFFVGPGVLIPRPETEILVEEALAACRQRGKTDDKTTILDIGTGCGNIAVAMAKHFPYCNVIATDCSPHAFEYAKKNVVRHAVADRVQLVLHDMRSAVPQAWRHRFDLILTNPPYIKNSEYLGLAEEIKNYEPKEALLAGEDGLEYYRILAHQLTILLKPSGYSYLEIGAEMGAKVKELFDQAGFNDIKIIKDLAGRDRIVRLCNAKENDI